jgi:hypothetical protein
MFHCTMPAVYAYNAVDEVTVSSAVISHHVQFNF